MIVGNITHTTLTLHHTVRHQVLRGVLGHFVRAGNDEDPAHPHDPLATALLSDGRARGAGGAQDQGGGREGQRARGWKCPVDAAGERACV